MAGRVFNNPLPKGTQLVKKAPRTAASIKAVNFDRPKKAVQPNPDGNRAERRAAKRQDRKR